MKTHNTSSFHNNLDDLVKRMVCLVGIKCTYVGHPFIGWVESARKHYKKGERVLGLSRVCYAKFLLEDLEKIKKEESETFQEFKRKLNVIPLPMDNYFGLRLEIRIAASLIGKKFKFNKMETPDFVLAEGGLGLECTSIHFDLEIINIPEKKYYKIQSAIETKSKLKYKTKTNILIIDITNLAYHIGNESQSIAALDKDVLKKELRKYVEKSTFESVLFVGFFWESGIDVRLSCNNIARIDRERMDLAAKKFLDRFHPEGDVWKNVHAAKVV